MNIKVIIFMNDTIFGEYDIIKDEDFINIPNDIFARKMRLEYQGKGKIHIYATRDYKNIKLNYRRGVRILIDELFIYNLTKNTIYPTYESCLNDGTPIMEYSHCFLEGLNLGN